MNLGGIQANYPQLCKSVDAAVAFSGLTLFLRGGWSDYVTPADEPDIRRLFPKAEIQKRSRRQAIGCTLMRRRSLCGGW